MLTFFGYLVADALVRLLPTAWCDALAVMLARAVFAARPVRRRVLERNLRALLGISRGGARRAARGAFENFARSFTDDLRLRRLDPAALQGRVRVRGWRHLERARARGRGLILLSAHLGNWEWGAALLASRGLPVHVLARRHRCQGIERMMVEMRRHWGVGVCEGAPLWTQASLLLRRRGCLAVMGDRGPQPGGDPLRPPRWAAALAHRTGAPLVPGVIVRRPGGGYTVFLEPELSPEECRRGAWRRVLVRYVRRYPEQWFAFEPGPGAAPA